jgi:hypothetical protein
MAIECRFEVRAMARRPAHQSRSALPILTPRCARRSKDPTGEFA